jgi:hypothetical protein
LYTTTITRISWTHTHTHHKDFHLFFYDISTSSQGSDFFLLTWQSKKDTKTHGATCTTSNANARAEEGIDIKGASFSSNSRYPVFVSVWNDATVGEGEQSERARAIREKKG